MGPSAGFFLPESQGLLSIFHTHPSRPAPGSADRRMTSHGLSHDCSLCCSSGFCCIRFSRIRFCCISFLLYSFLLFLVIILFPPECFFVLRHPLVSLFPRRLCIQNPVFPRYLFQSGECKPKNTVFFLLSDHCFPNCGNFFQLLNFDVAFSRYLYYNQFCKRIYPS